MIWRDTWDGTPGVVVIATHGPQDGQLRPVLLFLRLDTRPPAVTVTDEHGHPLRLRLPDDLEPFSITVRRPLTVEVTT